MYSNISNITQKCVDILLPFLSDYSMSLSASELSRKTKIPQQTITRNLNMLSAKGLLEYELVGKNKMFYFDLKKETSIIILKVLELHKSLKFYTNSRKTSVIIDEILKLYGCFLVFGSYALGTRTEKSDLDLLVIGNKKKAFEELKQRYFLDINAHFMSFDEFKKRLYDQEPLLIEIQRNHVLFGKTEDLVYVFANEQGKASLVCGKERRNKLS